MGRGMSVFSSKEYFRAVLYSLCHWGKEADGILQNFTGHGFLPFCYRHSPKTAVMQTTPQ